MASIRGGSEMRTLADFLAIASIFALVYAWLIVGHAVMAPLPV